MLLGALIMLAAISLLLAMVAGGVETGLLRSLAAYAGLFAGMAVASAGALSMLRR